MVIAMVLLLLGVAGVGRAAAPAPTPAAPDATAAAGTALPLDKATLQLQQYDALRVARCAAACWSRSPDAKDECEAACLRADYAKPGACPAGGALSAFDAACIYACSSDANCSATDKCCAHACGATCQRAQGLQHAPGLPPTPSNLTASERRHWRVVQVEWSPSTEAEAVVLYVLEERHHVGCHVSEERMGPWTPRHRSTRPSALLRGVLRPGRWYQFRAAAVNAHGSRGFSAPSAPFRLSLAPRAPGPPQSLRVGPLRAQADGALRTAVLSWEPPVSDLPPQRYKVFWSRRLDEDPLGSTGTTTSSTSASAKRASVLVHHQTVGGDVLQFTLKALEPNSLYFLQVQAIAQFGRERLKGEKQAIFLHTGNHTISGSSS